jgi:ribosomal protein S8E
VSITRNGAVALAFTLISPACLAVTGCGSGSTDPLSGMSASQVVGKAVSDLKSEPHFSISGKINSDGQNLGLALGYKSPSPSECQGTIGLDNKGSFGVVSIGDAVWVKPDNAFWKAFAGSSAQQAIAVLGGKYLKTSSSDPNMADMVKICNVNELSSMFANTGTVTKGAVTTIDGQRALALKDSKEGGTLYVTDTSAPRILQVTNPSKSDGGSLTFTYDTVTVTAPPASETVDGSKYGM